VPQHVNSLEHAAQYGLLLRLDTLDHVTAPYRLSLGRLIGLRDPDRAGIPYDDDGA
jgi:hypothetical protein